MILREGQAISYLGDDDIPLGAHGRLLATASATAWHVQWLDGPRKGQVGICDEDLLAPAPKRLQAALDTDGWEDSLEVGPVAHTGAARLAFDLDGAAGVLTMMASSGRLASFDAIADETLTFVEGQIRQEASVREVLAELDDEESSALVGMASRILLRDAFGGMSDEGE